MAKGLLAPILGLALAFLAGCTTTTLTPVDSPQLPPDFPRAPTAPGQPPLPPPLTDAEAKTMVARLIPATVKDRAAWAADLHAVFTKLDFPQAPEIYCAAIVVIEQESSWQTDPVVAGLPDIVWKELEQRGARYGVPLLLIKAALLKSSPDGRSYMQRIDALKTEKQLNGLFQDMIDELPFGKQLFADYNPVRTGGPMQVSIAFAEEYVRDRAYPWPLRTTVRDEVFTRRGGLYFGSAILLDYPAPYDNVLYRFADFNAGRYSSRNAAFQTALGRLTGKKLALDGDLLRYAKGRAVEEPSSVELAARSLGGRLQLTAGEIRRDLLLEKSPEFGQSPLFRRVFTLADQTASQPVPRQAMPQIDLKSPKITRKLTTDWFARRVDSRYRTCLTRANAS